MIGLFLFSSKCKNNFVRVAKNMENNNRQHPHRGGKKDRLTRDRYVIDSPPQTAN